MPVYARPSHETLHLADRGDASLVVPWAVFDPDWYRAQYPDAPDGSAEELLEWHLTRGQLLGHSPNRYFDEPWQRAAWPGILALIEARSVASAFDAWCKGAHSVRAPHWLFDPIDYRNRYPAVTDDVLAEIGFINHYHHYLSFGAAEGRIGHALFDPAVYLAALDPAEAKAAADRPFQHYLRGLETGAPEHRTSVLFDPAWYHERYPDAARAVASGQYRSLLEHYLRNDRPTEFDPSPWFSEEYYLAQNAGLAAAIGGEGFRNGFAHFLAYGLREGRSPHPDIDLSWYAGRDDVRTDVEAGRARDAFSHWITIGGPAGLPGRPQPVVDVTEAQAVVLSQRRANTIWPLYGRHKLDFTCHGPPTISVIMATRNQFAETMISLASVKAHFRGEIELILIDSEPASAAVDIETHVTGATILRFGAVLNDSAAREAGIICATAEVVLLLADGIDLAPGAIDNALARLRGDPAIGAVGGRLIQAHGVLFEAGGIIWRDGYLQAYARDASPATPEANFVRDVDFCSTQFLLARRDVLASLPDQDERVAGTSHDAADLCARIRQVGARVVYDPDVLAFLTIPVPDRLPDGQAAFVAAHPELAATRPAFDPAAAAAARSPRQGHTRVLFIEDSVPLRRIGSGFVRSNDVLRAMVASGVSVTVFPMGEVHFPLSTIRAELPDSVEVMHDSTAADFADFIATRRQFYDLIWIARTHNLDLIHESLTDLVAKAPNRPRLVTDFAAALSDERADPVPTLSQTFALDATLLREFSQFDADIELGTPGESGSVERLHEVPSPALARHGLTRPEIVVDTEAVASVRLAAQAALRNQPFELEAALAQEFRHLNDAMRVVAVTEAEAALIRPHHRGPVNVLGHMIAAAPTTRRFEERTGMLFVGAIHDMAHPNYDGLCWFVDEVLPIIERALRWETRLTVAGYTAPGITLDRFKGHARVTLRGSVADLAPLYDAHRVFIAPARFAAGIPYKVHEAAALGLPVVASRLLARQLGWSDAESLGAADISDSAGFAARVIALHRDATLWTRIREAALVRVRNELDPDVFAARVADLARTRTDHMAAGERESTSSG